jgi:CAAX protease family protein
LTPFVLAILEFLLIVAIFIADDIGLIPLTKTGPLLVVAWLSLRLRGLRWRDVGFVRPPSWQRAIVIGTAAGLAMELLALFVTEPMFARLAGADPGLEEFRPLVGHLGLTLLLILASWALAAFGEEAFYRGYLMHRVAALAGGSRAAWVVALVIATATFGWAHAVGQGLTGALQEGFAGLLLGLLFLASGRTLMIPITAHGVSNTLAFVLIYFGKYPGV